MSPLLAIRLIGAIAALALLTWAVATVNGWRKDAAQLPLEVQAREAAEAQVRATAAQIRRDDAARQALAADLEQTRAKYAALRAAPPVRSVVVREVPIREGQTACPDPRLSAEWGLRFDAAALNPDTAR